MYSTYPLLKRIKTEDPDPNRDEDVPSDLPMNDLPLHIQEREEYQAPTCETALNDFENVPGQYGFSIFIESISQPTKSVPWTYSSKLDQLFTKVNVPCPIQFNVTSYPKFGTVIKAVMYYKKQEHVNFPVERCVTHLIQDPYYQKSNLCKHVLRCEEQSSVYEETDEGEPRMSVSVPYKKPIGIVKTLTYNYKFTCLNSCPGGMNRQHTMVMFTLEHEGIILGKRILDVRICACPGRDRIHWENLKDNKEPISDDSSSNHLTSILNTENEPPLIRDIKRVLGQMLPDSQPPNKKKKTESNNSEVFLLEVRGRQNYEILSRINRALEMLSTLENSTKQS